MVSFLVSTLLDLSAAFDQDTDSSSLKHVLYLATRALYWLSLYLISCSLSVFAVSSSFLDLFLLKLPQNSFFWSLLYLCSLSWWSHSVPRFCLFVCFLWVFFKEDWPWVKNLCPSSSILYVGRLPLHSLISSVQVHAWDLNQRTLGQWSGVHKLNLHATRRAPLPCF